MVERAQTVMLDANLAALYAVETRALLQAVRCKEPALGWAGGAFMEAYGIGRQDANSVALESSPVIPVLEPLVGPIQVTMTSQELLDALEKLLDGPEASRLARERAGAFDHP